MVNLSVMRRWVARLAPVGVIASLIGGVASAESPSSAADPTPAAVKVASISGSGGEFHALSPSRVVDTRTGLNTSAGAKPLSGEGSVFEVPLLGQGGLPPSATDALAVVATVTVVGPTQPGYLKAWGAGRVEPADSSIVNFAAGSTVPNLAVLVPGSSGGLSIKLDSGGRGGSAHVLIDVFGWISTSAAERPGARLIPAGPQRVFDSRSGAAIGAGQSVRVPIRGVAGVVPADPAVSAVLVNITGMNNLASSATTFVSAVPFDAADQSVPTTSNLNLVRGLVKANLALVPLGADGAIRLFNERGDVHLAVDVVGYLRPGDPGTRQGRVVPLDVPFRVIDTRVDLPGAPAGRIGPGMAEDWDFSASVGDVRVGGVPVGAQLGFIGNLTGVGLQRPSGWIGAIDSYLTVFPTPSGAGGSVPEVSNLNLQDSDAVANLALVRYGTGDRADQVRFYNYNGFVNYIVDVSAVVLAD